MAFGTAAVSAPPPTSSADPGRRRRHHRNGVRGGGSRRAHAGRDDRRLGLVMNERANATRPDARLVQRARITAAAGGRRPGSPEQYTGRRGMDRGPHRSCSSVPRGGPYGSNECSIMTRGKARPVWHRRAPYADINLRM
ncbi:hypothetical protein A7982_12572 [Minicystis rosea]|nr:hypothetical protein A7982_12572 [Minicystis rosea]